MSRLDIELEALHRMGDICQEEYGEPCRSLFDLQPHCVFSTLLEMVEEARDAAERYRILAKRFRHLDTARRRYVLPWD